MRRLFSTMEEIADGYGGDKKLALWQTWMHITQLYISTHFTQTPAHTDIYGNLWHNIDKKTDILICNKWTTWSSRKHIYKVRNNVVLLIVRNAVFLHLKNVTAAYIRSSWLCLQASTYSKIIMLFTYFLALCSCIYTKDELLFYWDIKLSKWRIYWKSINYKHTTYQGCKPFLRKYT